MNEQLCECELRNRQWNGFGKCLTCGKRYGTGGRTDLSRPAESEQAATKMHAVLLHGIQSVRFMNGNYVSRGDGGWRASGRNHDDEYTYTTFADALEGLAEAQSED